MKRRLFLSLLLIPFTGSQLSQLSKRRIYRLYNNNREHVTMDQLIEGDLFVVDGDSATYLAVGNATFNIEAHCWAVPASIVGLES